MSRAVKVFADGSGELFGTVRALDEFTGALAANDAAVSRFMGNLGAVSQQLAGEKDELAAALSNLAGVLGKVEQFVRGNRELLVKDVENLTRILGVAGRRAQGARRRSSTSGRPRWATCTSRSTPSRGRIGSRINVQGNVQDLDNLLCTMVRNGDLPSRRAGVRAVQGAAGADRPSRLEIPVAGAVGAAGRRRRPCRSGTATAQPALSLSRAPGRCRMRTFPDGSGAPRSPPSRARSP